MDKPAFTTDAQGHLITKPVLGFSSAVIADMAVLLVLSYADSPEAFEVGESRAIQFAMSPEQCFDVAETLIKQAKRIMDPSPSGGIIQ
jgi:hypothetical protein